MVIFSGKPLNYQSVRENGGFFGSMSFASHLLSDCFPFPSWKLTINWPEVFPGLELHTIQRWVLFQWFLSNPFQISIGFKCFSWFHVISCWFMLCLDIYGWFIHRYSQFFGFKTRSDLFTDEFQQRPEDSRNGMIWIFDMPSGTCTSALSCHSQQVRCHGWQGAGAGAGAGRGCGNQPYGVILYPI